MTLSTWQRDGKSHGSQPFPFQFPTGTVNRHSRVVCSICEIVKGPDGKVDYPHIGEATLQTLNVAPDDTGTVKVWITVNWTYDLDWRVSFFIDT